jgi:hypothetical protein
MFNEKCDLIRKKKRKNRQPGRVGRGGGKKSQYFYFSYLHRFGLIQFTVFPVVYAPDSMGSSFFCIYFFHSFLSSHHHGIITLVMGKSISVEFRVYVWTECVFHSFLTCLNKCVNCCIINLLAMVLKISIVLIELIIFG